jgi:hypothetical protein
MPAMADFNGSGTPPVALGGMQPGLAPLHVVWPMPSIVIGGIADVIIMLDGRPVWQVPFEHGVDVIVPTLPGRHRVDVRIHLKGAWERNRGYDLEVTGAMRLDLHYSRFWGNFSKKVKLQRGA